MEINLNDQIEVLGLVFSRTPNYSTLGFRPQNIICRTLGGTLRSGPKELVLNRFLADIFIITYFYPIYIRGCPPKESYCES